MAKAKTLAALAGLAGLAYAMRNKGDKDDKRTDTRSPGDEMSSASRKMPDDDRMSNEDYIKSRMKKAPEDENGSAQSDVLKAITAPKTAPNDKAPNQGVVPSGKSAAAKQAPSNRREDEVGTSRGQRSFTSRSSGDEMSSAAKSYKAPAPTTSSKVADTATDAVKTVAKAAVQGPAASMATAAKPLADKATNAMRETYRDLSGKVQYKTPDIPSAAKTVGDAVASGAKKVGSGIADYANRTFTLEGRERAKKEADDARAKAASFRENDEDALSKGSAMRRGGMTKMASGGMTASRRGDGIASRGKTRGRIC